jgi:hypothetical protein
VPKSGCATAKTPPHNQTDPLPTAALRDFDSAYVRFVPILLQKSLMVLANNDSVASDAIRGGVGR